jgi:RNA polymerase sigma factor (sigma-70 family)
VWTAGPTGASPRPVMEASALKHTGIAGIRGPTPLLRLQSDERLIALVRKGNQSAFEALVGRYQSRLLAFCRHMLGSREDAEDVLQEVFAAAFNAILADDRPINARPWLYRIARNRSLNHLRRTQPIGVDSMDVHFSEGGLTTADKVHEREEFRQLISDVQDLPETQKTALLLREIDALSYEQIAEAMETTVPSVKSLLVRARVSLAEAAEARKLTCEEVREELGEVAEGLRRTSAPVRRHLRTCDRCQGFRGQLKSTNKAMAALFPVAPLLLFKKALLAQFGMTASAGAGSAAGAAAAGVAATSGASAMSAGISTIATKTAAGLAAAAIVTTGAIEVRHVSTMREPAAAIAAAPAPARPAEPEVVASTAQPMTAPVRSSARPGAAASEPAPAAAERPARVEDAAPTAGSTPDSTVGAPADPASDPARVAPATPPVGPTQEESQSVTAPGAPAPPRQTGGTAAPAEPVGPSPTPAPTPAPAPVVTGPPPAAAPVPVVPAPVAPPLPVESIPGTVVAHGSGGTPAP